MIDKIIKYFPITTTVVLFLYVCGGLYLVGFWSIYGLDLLGAVSIIEIPKSFILPFSLALGLLFIASAILWLVYFGRHPDKIKPPIIAYAIMSYMLKRAEKSIFFHIDFWIIVIGGLIFILSFVVPKSEIFWVLSFTLLPSLVILKIMLTEYVSSRLSPNTVIFFLLFALCVLTISISFGLGKARGIEIYKNVRIISIKNLNNNNVKIITEITDSASLKLVGFLGGKVIISDLENKNMYIINEADFKGVKFELKTSRNRRLTRLSVR